MEIVKLMGIVRGIGVGLFTIMFWRRGYEICEFDRKCNDFVIWESTYLGWLQIGGHMGMFKRIFDFFSPDTSFQSNTLF